MGAILMAVSFSVLTPTRVAAQDIQDEETPGRRALQRGIAAAQEERWDEALAEFERAYALDPRPALRLNIATARAELGQLLAARAAYEAILESTQSDQMRDAAERGLGIVDERVPTLRVEATSGQPTRLEIDGRERRLRTRVDLDPGEHLVVVTFPEGRTRITVNLATGDQRDIAIAPPPRLPAAATATDSSEPQPEVDDGRRRVRRRRAILITVGLVLAGGAVAAVLLTRTPDGLDLNGGAVQVE